MKMMSRRGWFFLKMVSFGLVLFELFNYSSDLEGLRMIFGDAHTGPFRWATLIAFGLCILDFGSLGRLIVPEEVSKEIEQWKTALFAAWVLSALFETFLTYFVIANKMAEGGVPVMVSAGLISSTAYYQYVPIGFSILVMCIQTILVVRLGGATDSVIGDRGAPKKPASQSSIRTGGGKSEAERRHQEFLRRMSEMENDGRRN